MAAPMGGHPTLARYLGWLREQGFDYRTGILGQNNSLMSVIEVVDPQGNGVLSIAGGKMDERLVPTTVAYFDKRLGVDSPFSKLDRED